MFWSGFYKKAASGDSIRHGTVIGTGLGYGLGALLAGHQNKKVFEKWRQEPGRKDAKTQFEKIKDLSPKVQLITESDLNRMIKKEKDLKTVSAYQGLRNALEHGNAMALHPEMVPKLLKWMLPEKLRDKKVIFAADKVHPSTLAHEMGHIIDFDEVGKSGFLKKFYKKNLRSTMKTEVAAWEKAPGEKHDQAREEALSTYRRGLRYPVIGAIGGGLIGAAIGSQLE